MKTLRAKIALVLVLSIVSVVALITVTMMYAFRTPTERVVDLFARQLITMQQFADRAPGKAGLVAVPPAGEPDQTQTELLRAATARLGYPLDMSVTYKPDDSLIRTVAVPVGQRGWLVVDFDPPSDPELWGWLALIMLGVGSIAVLAAGRISRPLAMLESAVESVSPDGILPALAEKGPTEVRATAAAINSLSTRLKHAVESRMRLVAAAGHDLRTPLTRMRLRAEFVSDEEEQSLWLADIEELERIADSAIQLVREETTAAPPEAIRIDALVRSIADELKDQRFAVEVAELSEAYVGANRLALSRALRNLFINAATHGVSCVVNVMVSEQIEIKVYDIGPGLSEDELEQVFEPFFRVDKARRQNVPGAGLGLTISCEIVKRLGGDIHLENRPGGGLLQIVTLPPYRKGEAC